MKRRASGKAGLAVLLATVVALGGFGYWIYRDTNKAPIAVGSLVVDVTPTDAGGSSGQTADSGAAGGTTGAAGDGGGAATTSGAAGGVATASGAGGQAGVVYRLDQAADGLWA